MIAEIKDTISDSIEFMDSLLEMDLVALKSKKIKIAALKNRLSQIIER